MQRTPHVAVETEHHPLPDGEVTLLGAAHGVTGAMTLVEQGGRPPRPPSRSCT